MSKLTKLERSQNAHTKLQNKYKALSLKSSLNSKNSFIYNVKRDYHQEVLKLQAISGRKATLNEKQHLYNRTKKLEIEWRQELNLNSKNKAYIPDKNR